MKLEINQSHECKEIEAQEGERILQVLKLNGKWYFVTYEKEAYGIGYCPFCGEELNDESHIKDFSDIFKAYFAGEKEETP